MTEDRGRDDRSGDQQAERLPVVPSTGIPGWVWDHMSGFVQDRERGQDTDEEHGG
jgi:hypothetical protein